MNIYIAIYKFKINFPCRSKPYLPIIRSHHFTTHSCQYIPTPLTPHPPKNPKQNTNRIADVYFLLHPVTKKSRRYGSCNKYDDKTVLIQQIIVGIFVAVLVKVLVFLSTKTCNISNASNIVLRLLPPC